MTTYIERERAWLDDRLPGVSKLVRRLVERAVIDGPFGLSDVSTWRISLTSYPSTGHKEELVLWLANSRGGTMRLSHLEHWQSHIIEHARTAETALAMLDAMLDGAQ